VARIFNVLLVSIALCVLPAAVSAQGRIAVVNLEEAILQTDVAQATLNELRTQADYVADKAELDKLQAEREALIKELQNDLAVMSAEQQQAARKRMASKNADLEHVLRKLQKSEQELGQALLQEMTPKVQLVLRDLIASEGIGLLLQQSSVIHADNGYSITAKVTDKLNQQAATE
jgi:outer membrane protein